MLRRPAGFPELASGDGYTVQRFIASILKGEDVLDGKLGALKHPTLLIWGREDALTPLSLGERFKMKSRTRSFLSSKSAATCRNWRSLKNSTPLC